MKSFRTELLLSPASARITLNDSVVTLGSCFSDSIGGLLRQNKFDALVNPLGTAYSPAAIHQALGYAVADEVPNPALWVEQQGKHHHLDFHSSFSNSDKKLAELALSERLRSTKAALKKPGFVLLTYGTAFVYEHLASGSLIANCHKLPAAAFRKILLTTEQIIRSFDSAYQALKKMNPGKEIMLSLSPVRHLRDSMELNSVSKATLRRAIHEIVLLHPDVHYFPAFEIMVDDLRDYRFYDRDMLHPSDEAVGYIWEKFSDRYFDAALRALLSKWNSVSAALHHRAFHPGTPEHQAFLRETLLRLEELKTSLSVDEEINQLRAQLI